MVPEPLRQPNRASSRQNYIVPQYFEDWMCIRGLGPAAEVETLSAPTTMPSVHCMPTNIVVLPPEDAINPHFVVSIIYRNNQISK